MTYYLKVDNWDDISAKIDSGEIDHVVIRGVPYDKVRYASWSIDHIHEYEMSYGTTAYEPVYRCSACGATTESYLRLDEPIMPEDADFPRYCPWCGANMSGGERT